MISRIAVTVTMAVVLHMLLGRFVVYLKNKAYANQFGCLPPPRLQNHWPLGLDRIKQIWEADADSRLMDLFLFHFRKWGNTLEQVFLGTHAYATIDPVNLEVLLSSPDFGMGLRRQIFFPLFGNGIFTQDGLEWKQSRDKLRPHFSPRHYRDLKIFRTHTDKFLQLIPYNDEVVDLQPLFFRLTMDITTDYLFAESVHSLQITNVSREKSFTDAFNEAQTYVAKRYRLQDFYWFIGGDRFQKSCSAVYEYTHNILTQRLKKAKRGESRDRSLLDMATDQSGNHKDLCYQMINILVAGRDTTACLLSWTFRLLVRHPRVLKELRHEINLRIDPRADICREDLHRIDYLTLVLKETLRLYPSVPVNSRTAIKTTKLPTGGGLDRNAPILIPKGSAVAYSVYALHRRTDLYGEDAEEFRPERWKDLDLNLFHDEKSTRWGYLPFNGGPRMCLGSMIMSILRFALLKTPFVFTTYGLHADHDWVGVN